MQYRKPKLFNTRSEVLLRENSGARYLQYTGDSSAPAAGAATTATDITSYYTVENLLPHHHF
jgi:hypothetical protein